MASSYFDMILNDLNQRLTEIRKDIEANRKYLEHPEPGQVFFAPCRDAGAQSPLHLMVLHGVGNGLWLCCKLALENEFAGFFDLILPPNGWSGKYRVMIETWNTVRLHEEDIGNEFTDTVYQDWMNQAQHLSDAFRKGLPVTRDEFFGPEMEPIDFRFEFQEREAEAVANMIIKKKRVRLSVIMGGKAKIENRFGVDKRVGFDFPYQMALQTSDGLVAPVENISPITGGWDIVQSKEANPRLNCLVPTGVITVDVVKKTESERIDWIITNQKVFYALSLPDVREKIRYLETLFHDSDHDPYVAFNLAWIQYFENEMHSAAEYLHRAITGFPLPEYKSKAVLAKQIFDAYLPKDLDAISEPTADVWKIRCRENNPRNRIFRMKEAYIRSFSSYIAYEIASEYRYLGISDPDNYSYGYYTDMRNWAERALCSRDPLEQNIRRWAENMVRKIAPYSFSVPEKARADVSACYVPINKGA